MTIVYNVWKIFYLILASAFIVFSILLYFSFENIEKRHFTETEHYADIISKTFHAKLLQNEMMLDLVGKYLLVDKANSSKESVQTYLDQLLKKNPYLAAFGLSDLDGNLLNTSSNILASKRLNLLKTNKINNDFKKVLETKSLYVGRTYYFKALNDWVIPLRKAIHNPDGEIIGVMTSGLKNSKNTNYLDSIQLAKKKNIVIILDSKNEDGFYRIYSSISSELSNEELYNTPISTSIYNDVEQQLLLKYGKRIKELKENGQVASYKGLDIFNNKNISAITYDKEYRLWIAVHTQYTEVLDEFMELLFIYTTLFIVIFILFFLLFKNIASSERRKKDELIFQAEHDTLTQLPNRTYMYKHLKKWLEKHKNKYYVLYIDLDNFKNINDKFGHTIGDKILVEVASRLRLYFRDDDMLIRQGGDEFIILKDCENEDMLEKNFKELIALVSEVYYIDAKEFRIGMSVGISKYPNDALEINELLSLADTAMYEAKRHKNSYSLFSEKMRHSTIVRADMEQELRGAIEHNELWMVYQPQINADDSLYGVEALVRWENKKLGFVGPDKFISVAEETGLIREIGKFIILHSLQEINQMKEELGIEFSLSINISVIQLLEDDFLSTLMGLISEVGFLKTDLTLEITESQSINDLDTVLPLLQVIRDEGMEISLDDFGTGYSSLSMLRELPINELKIDKSFIDEIMNDKSENALVRSIINIGKNFGLKTLAEGVESLEQVEELKGAKCDIFQGYFYSKPLDITSLKEFIKRKEYDRR